MKSPNKNIKALKQEIAINCPRVSLSWNYEREMFDGNVSWGKKFIPFSSKPEFFSNLFNECLLKLIKEQPVKNIVEVKLS